MLTAAEVQSLKREFQDGYSEKILRWGWAYFGEKAGIGTSFQGAGLVMIDLARKAGLNFPVFTIDTGFLFPETIALKSRLEEFFGRKIEGLQPDLTVEQQESSFGAELWKRDPDMCCTMRKVMPLQSKLADLDCWITGLRRVIFSQLPPRFCSSALMRYVDSSSLTSAVAVIDSMVTSSMLERL